MKQNVTSIAQVAVVTTQNCKYQIKFKPKELQVVSQNDQVKVDFDFVYKYQNQDEDEQQSKRCVKQIYKQVILPKIVTIDSQLMIFPVFDNQQILHYSEIKKQNLLYIVVKDLFEMKQQTSMVPASDSTPRNQVNLEIYEISQKSQLIAKMDAKDAKQVLQMFCQHQQARSNSIIKLRLLFKNIASTFIFYKVKSSNENYVIQLQNEIYQHTHTFIIMKEHQNNKDIMDNLKSYRRLIQDLENSVCSQSLSQNQDQMGVLQQQINDLKNQLSSQTTLITQLYQEKQRKKSIRERKFSTTDHDCVIIEESPNEKTNAANNQGAQTDDENLAELQLLQKLSLEFNKKHSHLSDFRRSLGIKSQKSYSQNTSFDQSSRIQASVQQSLEVINQEFNNRPISSYRDMRRFEEILRKSKDLTTPSFLSKSSARSTMNQNNKNFEIEKILLQDQIEQKVENNSDDSLDIGEERIVNDNFIQNSYISGRNIPRQQQPQNFIDKLNQTQIIGSSTNQSRTLNQNVISFNTIEKTPQFSTFDSECKHKIPKAIQLQNHCSNFNTIKQSDKMNQTTQYSAKSQQHHQNKYQIKTLQTQDKKVKQTPINLNKNKNIKSNMYQGRVNAKTIDLSYSKAQSNSKNNKQIPKKQQTALNNLNKKIINSRKQQSCVVDQTILDNFNFSRSPSIMDEQKSNHILLERPKTILMGEKNLHQMYFKVNSNEQSLRQSAIQTPKPNFSPIKEETDNQDRNLRQKKTIPKMNITIASKNKQQVKQSITYENSRQKSMICNFYNNKPKSPALQQNLSINRKITDLQEARIRNRSESRQRQRLHNYSTLNKSGVMLGSGNQSYFEKTTKKGVSQCNLDETLQAAKDILQMKRNQSQTNIKQHIPPTSVNQSQLGINASLLFDSRQNELKYHTKPPLTSMEVHQKVEKENYDEFFIMYETFKNNNSSMPRRMQSPNFNRHIIKKSPQNQYNVQSLRLKQNSDYATQGNFSSLQLRQPRGNQLQQQE